MRDLNQVNGRAMLLFHLMLSIVTETEFQVLLNCKKEMWWSTIMHEP